MKTITNLLLTMLTFSISSSNHLDPKVVYYVAETYADLGEKLKAYDYYRLWIKLVLSDKNKSSCGETEGQAYQASYKSAHLATELLKNNPKFSWDLALSHFLEAFSIYPRAEPLLWIAKHYWDEGSLELCFLFARRAAEIPYPTNTAVLIEPEVYNFNRYELLGACAAKLEKYDISEWALRKALEAKPESDDIARNLEIVLMCKQMKASSTASPDEPLYYEYQDL